jgi:hypothetical protein
MLRAVVKLLFVVFLISPLITLGCGGKNEAKSAQVTPGEMPAGGEWTGVYYATVEGFLHLVHNGDTITGAWRTTAGDAWGELSGQVNGDLFKYEWTEHTIGMVGPSATKKGRGYFKYKAPRADDPHEIVGERGLKNDETGSTWKAIKQVNRQPDLKSVRPDEIEGRVEAGGWDDRPDKPEGEEEEQSDDETPDLE